MIRRPPRSTLFPTRRSSDLTSYDNNASSPVAVEDLHSNHLTTRMPLSEGFVTSDTFLSTDTSVGNLDEETTNNEMLQQTTTKANVDIKEQMPHTKESMPSEFQTTTKSSATKELAKISTKSIHITSEDHTTGM